MSFPLYRAMCMSDLIFRIQGKQRCIKYSDYKDHLLAVLSSNTTGYYIDLLAAILVYYPVHISYQIAYQLLPPELIPHSQYTHNTSFTHILFHTDSSLLQPLSSIPPTCNRSAIMTSIPPTTANYYLHSIAAAYAISGPPAMYCFARMMLATGGQWNNAL